MAQPQIPSVHLRDPYDNETPICGATRGKPDNGLLIAAADASQADCLACLRQASQRLIEMHRALTGLVYQIDTGAGDTNSVEREVRALARPLR